MTTYCFDLDGIICTTVPTLDYREALPIRDTIEKINKLHRAGHEIIIHTARGSKSGLDWSVLTVQQLLDWCVKYDVLEFGKPAADYYIDDKGISLEDLNEHI